ncbi:MAG: hypothetical protein Q9210_003334 [Variospora velana]
MKAIAKPTMPELPRPPPVVSRGAFYYGSDATGPRYLLGFANPQRTEGMDTRLTMTNRQHRSFWLGGWVDRGSSMQTVSLDTTAQIFQEGMLAIDHSDQTAKNISTGGLFGNKPRARGKMQFISGWGGQGIIVLIGGNQKVVTDTIDRGFGELMPMDEVDVFDVSSIYDDRILTGGTWYKQKVTGDIPERRVDFCVMLAGANDRSSNNIYMYGGRGANGSSFDDVHILSIPSFTWTKVYQGNSGRYGHTCLRAGYRTMLSVGGAPTTNETTGPCDWQTKGINVFDLSNITWSSKYVNSTKKDYEVPAKVIARIGGNGQGNATVKAPAEGFAASGLAQIGGSTFVVPLAASPPEPKRLIPNRVRRTIIACASVGGAIFVGLMILIAWLFRRWVRRIFVGDLSERLEMDGKGRNDSELPGQAVFWELPGSGPAELCSQTTSEKKVEIDEFKFETKSDRELGWRGEIECAGDGSEGFKKGADEEDRL